MKKSLFLLILFLGSYSFAERGIVEGVYRLSDPVLLEESVLREEESTIFQVPEIRELFLPQGETYNCLNWKFSQSQYDISKIDYIELRWNGDIEIFKKYEEQKGKKHPSSGRNLIAFHLSFVSGYEYTYANFTCESEVLFSEL